MPKPKLARAVADAVLARAKAGVRPVLIAREFIGVVSLSTIYHLLSEARAVGEDVPYFSSGRIETDAAPMRRVTLKLTREERALLRRAALTRRTTAEALAGRIVAATVTGGIVDAVLDDGARA